MPASHGPLVIGRYALYGEIAAGGMATVHYGRLHGAMGFSRTVAVKRLHAQYAKDEEFVAMFVDEARLAARVRHPNVVPTVDVIATKGELFLVMEYVPGESLARLMRAARAEGSTVAIKVVAAVVCGVLHGLHAAHEATDEAGDALEIVHRDVSPQNVLVGVDGVARVLDFGVAKAVGRLASTRDGEVKGKLAYMAPEQLRQQLTDRRADVYAAGVVLWELLTSKRLFEADNEGAMITKILERSFGPPGTHAADLPATVDAVTMRALARNSSDRFGTPRQMALALEDACGGIATPAQVGDWVDGLASDQLAKRRRIVAAIEAGADAEGAAGEADVVETEHRPAVRLLPGAARAASSGRPAKIAREERPPPAILTPRLLAFCGGVAAAGAIFALVLVWRRDVAGSVDETSSAAPLAAKVVQVAPLASAEPAAAEAAPPPSMYIAAEGAPAATSATAPFARAKAAVRHPPARASTAAVPTAPPCAVKSFTDDAGVKHYFNECSK